MQPTKGKTNPVTQALQDEVGVIRGFTELLKLEQSALSDGNTDELLELANKKEQASNQINRLAAQRNQLLAAQGLPPDRAGIEAWCAKNPSETAGAAAWSSILSLASEARELNRLNGELIQLRMQFNSRALEALQGRKDALDLYGPDGQAKTHEHRRINHAV